MTKRQNKSTTVVSSTTSIRNPNVQNAIDQNFLVKDSRAIHVFQENKRKLTLNNKNKKETERIEVDGKAINTGIRCDYMLKIKADDLDIYIELKGTDLEHAKNQILATKGVLGEYKNSDGYIVCERVPAGTDQSNIKRDAKKKGVTLKIDCNQRSYDI